MPNRAPQNRHPATVHVCPVPSCGRKEIIEAKAWKATSILEDHGWSWTRQITEADTWHLLCPKHYDSPKSRTIYHDAEKNRNRVDLPLEK